MTKNTYIDYGSHGLLQVYTTIIDQSAGSYSMGRVFCGESATMYIRQPSMLWGKILITSIHNVHVDTNAVKRPTTSNPQP